MQIGITENGDACRDLSWIDRIYEVDGVIAITKGFNKTVDQALLESSKRIILHQTITGLGGTILEPGVPSYKEVLGHLYSLIQAGFPRTHIVIRVDPILPFNVFEAVTGIDYKIFLTMIIAPFMQDMKLTRLRYSYIDLYPHTRAGINEVLPNIKIADGWTIGYDEREKIQQYLAECRMILPESCAEPSTAVTHHVGCVSKRDFDILRLPFNQERDGKRKGSREACECCSAKYELLKRGRPCENQCAYCYWKHNHKEEHK